MRGSADCAQPKGGGTFVRARLLSTTSAGHAPMSSSFSRLRWRQLTRLAALLPGARASPDDEPVPPQQAPVLSITNPAIIGQDTAVTGQGATSALNSAG